MSHINQFPQARIHGHILKPDRVGARQPDLDPIRFEDSETVAWMLSQAEYIRRCRAGESDPSPEPKLTKAERNREAYERRKRLDPGYYSRAQRRWRKRHADR